jgi:hypothetical protein
MFEAIFHYYLNVWNVFLQNLLFFRNPQATRNLLDFKDNIDAFIKKITNTALKVDGSGSGGIDESPTQR